MIRIWKQSFFYTHTQDGSPIIWFHWRWKEYKKTFDVAIIINARWFGFVLDYSD